MDVFRRMDGLDALETDETRRNAADEPLALDELTLEHVRAAK